MGEIGGNDYNHALQNRKPIKEVEAYVPFVIKTIISAVNVSCIHSKYTLFISYLLTNSNYNNLFVNGYSWLCLKTQELIELGAETIVVPGNLPIGCSAAYLTIFYGSNDVEYDNATGCITELNKFAEYHNELLKTELNQIREVHPEVNIIYADYYNAAMQIFLSPYEYGTLHSTF